MKRYLFLALLPLLFSGCWTARIVTVAPDPINVSSYSTHVTIPKAHVTTTTRVTAADNDISLYLDLQAIGAAFAQSSNVQEFESLINNSSYMLSNLDLNRDGYVDYLRVMETVQGYAHVFVIQAVLAHNVYQDVATVVAEVPSVSTCHIQIVGDPFLYGPRFILEPVFLIRPLICNHLFRASYTPWRSPWYWDHFPSHYKHPVPIYIGHYHAYVDTYLRNHRYCNRVNYVEVYHFADYLTISARDRRNDYGRAHPDREFVARTASLSYTRSSSDPNRVVNARDIREAYDANNVTTTATTTRRASSTATPRSDSNAKAVSSTRSASTSSTPRTVSASATTVSTRSANANGTSTTASRSTGTASGSTGSRSASTATSRSTSAATSTTATNTATSRSASTTTSAGTSARSASTATSTSSSAPRSASTMVKSNVRSSGSSNTSIRTVSPSGKETTSNRTSSSARSSANSSTDTRSANVSSSTSRSSGSATARSTSTTSSSSSRNSGSSTGRR